jgi:hypothetical protein
MMPDPVPRPSDTDVERIRAHLSQRRGDLPDPLVLAWSNYPVLVMDRNRPWLLAPDERDPLRDWKGRMPIPRSARKQLAALLPAALPFTRIAIAHELDPAGPVQPLLPAMRQEPVGCSEELARALTGPPPAHPGVHRAAHALDRLLGGGTARTASRVVDLLFDPIVFGVVAPGGRPRHGEPCLWFPLAAWRW